MARGNLPETTPTVPSDSFFAISLLYLWARDTGKDLAAAEGVTKRADTSLINVTTLGLSELTAKLSRHRKYRLQGRLFLSANAKIRFVGPSAPAVVQLAYEHIDSVGDARVFLGAYSVSDIMLPAASVVSFDGIVHNGSSEGDFGISWAQNLSSITPTVMYAGSWLQHSLID